MRFLIKDKIKILTRGDSVIKVKSSLANHVVAHYHYVHLPKVKIKLLLIILPRSFRNWLGVVMPFSAKRLKHELIRII